MVSIHSLLGKVVEIMIMLDQFYIGVTGSFSIRVQTWFVDGDHIAFLDDMDEENASILVVLDFSEVSDTINHNFLLESLRGLETAGVIPFLFKMGNSSLHSPDMWHARRVGPVSLLFFVSFLVAQNH